jgi:two-component system sensor histidine kinase/response regulator
LHILLAEANEINQMVACGILEHAGHRVQVAQNGAEVAPMLAAHSFDLVLMDIQMPGMNGFQATAAIREMEKHTGAHMPVIAMTAHALAGYKEKCLAAGMDGYVTKRVRHDLLMQALAESQGKKIAMGASTDATKPAEPKPPEEGQFDIDDLIERLMGDEDLARRLAGAFVDRMPEQLINLANAIGNSDAQTTRLAAHSLKGAAANVGCPAMQRLASMMEKMSESGALDQASEVLGEFTAAFEAAKPAMQRFYSGK